MKINTKRLRKLFTNSFILITAVTLTSCTPVESIKLSSLVNTPVIEMQDEMEAPLEIIDTVYETDSAEQESKLNNEGKTEEEKMIEPKKTIYSFLTDELDTSKITNSTDYILDNLDELYSLSKITIEQQTLALYAYKKLITGGITKEIFEKQLNNIMVEQILPRCLDDETWEEYYGDLTKTLDEQESLFDTYGTLAWLIHNELCDNTHSYDNGIIKCKTLSDEFDNRYQK